MTSTSGTDETPSVEEEECVGRTTDEDVVLDDEGREPIPEQEFASLDEALSGDAAEGLDAALGAFGAADFLRPGGGWQGSEAPVERAIRIGRANGLTVTSLKRDSGSAGSDHHKSQRGSYAADMSNGRQPTPQMDRTARQIAAAVGRAGWTGGYLTVRANGMRLQLIWRAPDHYDHVHVGVRRGG